MTRSYIMLAVAGAVLLAVLAAWAIRESRLARDQQFRELQSYARATARALLGSAQSDMRRGCLHRERFGAVLESIVETTDLRFVLLRQGETQLVASAGSAPADLRWKGPEGDELLQGLFVHWETVRIQDCAGRGAGRGGGWGMGRLAAASGAVAADADEVALGPGSQLLVLGLDAQQAAGHIAGSRRRLAVMVVVGALAVLASLLAWGLSIRAQRLGSELRASHARAEYLEELHLAAAGLAHETRNPLGIMRGLAQQIADGVDLGRDRERALNIVEEADVASARLGEFLQYARVCKPEPGPVRIDALFERLATLLDGDLKTAGVTLQHPPSGLVIEADGKMLLQVLMNLLLNSLQATRAGDHVRLSCTAAHGLATVQVIDSGRGIDPALLPRVFKPYVSGRPNGHGIGLAIVKRIVDEHGWRIGIESEPGQGTVVTISGIREREATT
jgi:two-component system, NtrC family, sensor histidine kinase HydH